MAAIDTGHSVDYACGFSEPADVLPLRRRAGSRVSRSMLRMWHNLRAQGERFVEWVRRLGTRSIAATEERLHRAIKTGHDAADWSRERTRDAGRAVERQVRNRPGPALLIAAGIGFTLGVFFVRRR